MRDTYKKLTKVFREVFDDDSIELTPETTANDIDDWDSIEHINLIAAVEDAFGMRFQMREVSEKRGGNGTDHRKQNVRQRAVQMRCSFCIFTGFAQILFASGGILCFA